MISLVLAATAVLPTPLEVPPVLSVAPKCIASSDPNEIVVCARPNDQRIKPLSGPAEPSMARAETQIAKGVKAGLVAEECFSSRWRDKQSRDGSGQDRFLNARGHCLFRPNCGHSSFC
jgi:hypothetical protein